LPELDLPINELVERIELDNFNLLPLSVNHFDAYSKVPLLENHRDPFDRLLLAIAISEDIPIISADRNFEHYNPQVCLIKN
jgi:PIN domain nuclease of toxin-antitoxin system